MKKHLNMNTLYLAAAIIAVSAFMLPRVIEAVNLHLNGISYIADQTEEYYKITEPVEGEYTVELDLNDLENNEGKILYDDGDSQISVMKVVEQEEKGYEVVFRSHAKDLPEGAVLVSGIAHDNTEDGSTHSIEAEATAGKDAHQLSPSTATGLSYKDGDHFGFYLDAPAEEADKVAMTVTNLQLNLWMEKAIFE
ncbi:hypothetical protein [Planomicrobium okeanokoites]|uniref:hypothetical protein n=1 Tax=Planomicrobium okeanokoites TaxID=244 RepID=UPI000A008376|nr:hypothetical protein [Planomicrobium okeanokoites]